MTTEELKTLHAQAESGDVSSMIRLTHIYGEKEGYLDYAKALKWFLELIQAEFNFHKQAQYDHNLLKKITDRVLSADDESDVPGLFQELYTRNYQKSLFAKPLYFSSTAEKNMISTIYQIEKKLQEEERIAKVKKEEAEAAARKAEEARKRAEAEAREAEAKARQAEAEAKRAEEARKKAQAEAEARKAEEARRKAEAELELARRKAEEEVRRRKELERQEKEWRAMMKQNIEEDYAPGSFNPNTFLSDHLDIPDSVTKIGERAFESCWLTSIYVPDSVQTIGAYAFANSALQCIGISDGVQDIKAGAFDSCLFLTQIMVRKGSKQRFAQMEGLKDLSSIIVEE